MLNGDGCPSKILAIKDAVEAVHGRWKLQIVLSLGTGGKRFNEISKEVGGITDKMLSKELKALEANKLIQREVIDGFPPVVAYSMTPHGASLQKLMESLYQWGMEHRKEVIGK
ncbi:winged helix-turn-helix transcriptional regulator [Dinghuibacter silviterrae]|uniref:HxlR family transcriptional regulator n=1 Tax=Dinghuibacter silviterrae TaxID=1539049 RepID=A0A4R8DUG4_9BACT|nr:helix-turn-helix domain-containing protein [Dinghuibacter silviterrae]TDX01558.1 HxlR family transcriptional regulator [Dinghuibacter silviterrae]